METNVLAERNEKLAERTVKALKQRHFDAYYCKDKREALEKALELIPANDAVAWGGSATVKETGLIEKLRERGNTLLDRNAAKTPEERDEIQRAAFGCGTFLMSANAVSEDGQLVNIDGNGNRVAALIYGPRSVLVIAGMNKLCATLDAALTRAETVAAPINAQRFDINTPCKLDGSCHHCVSPDCICSQVVVTRTSRYPGRIKVILVGEQLGF